MAKKETKKELEMVEISDEQIEEMNPLKGKMFLEFIKMGKSEDNDETVVFRVMIKSTLRDMGIDIEDPEEQLDLSTYSKVLMQLMEINNMEELFQTFEKFNRNSTD